MKNANQSHIQAKMFEFAVFELVRIQRNSFQPIWTVDSWVKFLIWLSLNCGLSGEQESLENFAVALGPALSARMRKVFFERSLDSLFINVIADPADSKVLVLSTGKDMSVSNQKCLEALESIGLAERVVLDFSKWDSHDQLLAIPWNSSESGC